MRFAGFATIKIDKEIGKAELQTEANTSPKKSSPAPSRRAKNSGVKRAQVVAAKSTKDSGRYSLIWPDGKKYACNVYAHSEEKSEKLLAEPIARTKEEIHAEKEQLKTDFKAD